MTGVPRRVVIVDDHASFRCAADELLRARGHAVVGEASNGADAFVLVQRVAPDVAVVDLRLGDECGLQVAQVLTRMRGSGARGFVGKSEFARADLAALWDAGA